MENKDRKLGALWIKESARGEYMSGLVKWEGKEIPVVCFRNTNKEKGDRRPDWDMLVAKKSD